MKGPSLKYEVRISASSDMSLGEGREGNVRMVYLYLAICESFVYALNSPVSTRRRFSRGTYSLQLPKFIDIVDPRMRRNLALVKLHRLQQ